MELQEQAQHTIDIEYPGMNLLQAYSAANERLLEKLSEMQDLEAEIKHARYLLDQATYEYHEASRAANLFENALNEGGDDDGLLDENTDHSTSKTPLP